MNSQLTASEAVAGHSIAKRAVADIYMDHYRAHTQGRTDFQPMTSADLSPEVTEPRGEEQADAAAAAQTEAAPADDAHAAKDPAPEQVCARDGSPDLHLHVHCT